MDMFVHDEVLATLTELGLTEPSRCIQTVLIGNGRFLGHKFIYDGGFAVLEPDGSTLEIYDAENSLPKTVTIGPKRQMAA